MNLYKHAKNQDITSFSSGDIVYLKILQSDWPAESILAHISEIWDLCRNIANNINKLYAEQIQKKLITKFSNEFKKP